MQMIEKKRRDRINNSLNDLRRLVPAAFEKQGSAKLEKAEILQMTVDHLTMLHAKGKLSYHFLFSRGISTSWDTSLLQCLFIHFKQQDSDEMMKWGDIETLPYHLHSDDDGCDDDFQNEEDRRKKIINIIKSIPLYAWHDTKLLSHAVETQITSTKTTTSLTSEVI